MSIATITSREVPNFGTVVATKPEIMRSNLYGAIIPC